MTEIQNSKQIERPLYIEQVTDMFWLLVLGICYFVQPPSKLILIIGL